MSSSEPPGYRGVKEPDTCSMTPGQVTAPPGPAASLQRRDRHPQAAPAIRRRRPDVRLGGPPGGRPGPRPGRPLGEVTHRAHQRQASGVIRARRERPAPAPAGSAPAPSRVRLNEWSASSRAASSPAARRLRYAGWRRPHGPAGYNHSAARRVAGPALPRAASGAAPARRKSASRWVVAEPGHAPGSSDSTKRVFASSRSSRIRSEPGRPVSRSAQLAR